MQREEKKSKEKFLGLKTGKVETLGKFFKKGRVMLERDRILIPLYTNLNTRKKVVQSDTNRRRVKQMIVEGVERIVLIRLIAVHFAFLRVPYMLRGTYYLAF
ncbi:hypothetical protein YC2023_063585 [Brassica napus]